MKEIGSKNSFTKLVMEALEAAGSWCLKIHGHRYQKGGVPDLYIANLRWSGWIELKVGDRDIEPLQELNLKALLARGVAAFVVRWKDGIVYCELGKETLAYCEDWNYVKGATRGLSLLKMFNDAGDAALKIMKG